MSQKLQNTAKILPTVLPLACFGTSTACRPSQTATPRDATETTAKVSAEGQSATAKRYPLTGRVISVDKPNQSINIDGDEIPGFMSAMKMPYPVKDPGILERVSPGDRIKAEVVVGSGGTYMENVVVATRAQTPAK